MPDWATISELATAGGTLALAAATFAAVRSANRAARVSELALQEQRRPVLVHSRDVDLVQTINFSDDQWLTVPGGGAAAEATSDAVYLAVSLRNVGAGIAVMQGWHAAEGAPSGGAPSQTEVYIPLARDQYIPGGDIGLWQGAVREPGHPLHAMLSSAITQRRPFTLDLLYTDQVGGQRTITRFGVLPRDEGWLAAVARHLYVDAGGTRR